MNITGKIVPCLDRKCFEAYDGGYVYIPLSDKERKLFVPDWGAASSPAWEIKVTDYEKPKTEEETENPEEDTEEA